MTPIIKASYALISRYTCRLRGWLSGTPLSNMFQVLGSISSTTRKNSYKNKSRFVLAIPVPTTSSR
jgi:hypothetical protein